MAYLPGANLSIDAEKKIIKSNYQDGANIIVASADEDVVVQEEQGYMAEQLLDRTC